MSRWLARSAHRAGGLLADHPRTVVWVGYLLLALAFTARLYRHPTFAGWHLDWLYFHFLNEVSRITLLEYGELPLWNPWACGGTVHLANAQSQFLSPYFALYLVTGVAIGQKLFILTHYWLGLVGMHRLMRRGGHTSLAALAAAILFGLCGFHAVRAGGGHAGLLGMLYLPWVLLAYESARQDLRNAIWIGLLGTATLFEGGAYPCAFFFLLLAFHHAYDLVRTPREWRHLLLIGPVSASAFISTAAIKLGPVLQFLSEQPRRIPVDDRLGIAELLEAFLSRSLAYDYPGHPYVWPEYLNYTGAIPLLALLLIWRQLREEPVRRWYLATLVFGLIMLGDHGPLAPYTLLHQLPLYDSLRVPSRYGVLVVLHISMIFGLFIHGLDQQCHIWFHRIRARRIRHLVRRGALLLLAVATLDLWLTSSRLFWPGFIEPPRPPLKQPLFQGEHDGEEQWWRVSQNEGTPLCYEPNPIPTSALIWRGRQPQIRLADPAAGEVELLEFSPNRWRVRIRSTVAGRLLINQNHHRHWRTSSPGAQIVNDHGLLAVDFQAASDELLVQYRPAHLEWFALCSGCAMLVCAILVVRRPGTQRRDARSG